MNKQMLFIPRANYVAPECEALEMKVEGIICNSKNANTGTEYFGIGSYEEL